MSLTIYLWQQNRSNEFRAEQRGQVHVDGPDIRVSAAADPAIAELVAHLRGVAELPLTIETREGEAPHGNLVISRIYVTPDDERFGFAVGEALGKVGGYLVSFEPEAPL